MNTGDTRTFVPDQWEHRAPVCVACEGKPTFPNDPCAVCGATAYAARRAAGLAWVHQGEAQPVPIAQAIDICAGVLGQPRIGTSVLVPQEALRAVVEGDAVSADPVNHPSHYGSQDNPYEVIKVLKAWLTPEEFRGFCKGNIHKYLARANGKGKPIEDAAKAAWYARELNNFNAGVVNAKD